MIILQVKMTWNCNRFYKMEQKNNLNFLEPQFGLLKCIKDSNTGESM